MLSLLVACGGDDDSAEPLVAGSVTGSYEGRTFTAFNGVTATLTQGDQTQAVIAVGTGNLYCGIEDSTEPPNGNGVILRATEFVMGPQSLTVLVFETDDDGNYQATGTSGTLDVTAITETSIAATLSFSAIIEEMEYAANGTFEVVRCP